jgi:PAS domain S-box-containing protein
MAGATTKPGGSTVHQERVDPQGLAPRFPLSVLLVEDNPADAELCICMLERSRFDLQCDVVKTAEEFIDRLSTRTYDVILSDYNLGHWTGMDALELLHKDGADIPFILVTGALGDETAVECVGRGVTDYVLKDRLERLPTAISRALEERGQREERRQAERSLKESEAKFRALAEGIPTAVFIEQGTQCRYVNHAAECTTGYNHGDLLSMNFWSLVLPSDRKVLVERAANHTDDDQPASRYEIRIIAKNGQVRWLDVTVRSLQIEGKLAALISAFDITERKDLELVIPGLVTMTNPLAQ